MSPYCESKTPLSPRKTPICFQIRQVIVYTLRRSLYCALFLVQYLKLLTPHDEGNMFLTSSSVTTMSSTWSFLRSRSSKWKSA
jgi:hypothetical protein